MKNFNTASIVALCVNYKHTGDVTGQWCLLSGKEIGFTCTYDGIM